MKKYTSWRYWRGKSRALASAMRPKSPQLALANSVLGQKTHFPILGLEELVRAYGIASEPVATTQKTFNYTLYENDEARTGQVTNTPPARLALLHLRNVLCLHNGGLLTEDGFLMDAATTGLHGPSVSWEGEFAVVDPHCLPSRGTLEVVDLPCLYMDAVYRNAYGHVLVDALPRLWALPHVPEKRFGLFTTAGFKRVYIDEFFSAAARHTPVIRGKGTVLCRNLYVPVQPHRLAEYVCAQAHTVWQRIGDNLSQAKVKNAPRRIYFSRRYFADRRCMVDEERVEALFRARGFAVMYPEREPLARQVAAVRQADVLAGPFGSAMHNSVFGRPDLRVFIVTPAAINYYPLIDCTAGHPFAYFLGRKLDETAIYPDPLNFPWKTGDPDALGRAVDAFLATG